MERNRALKRQLDEARAELQFVVDNLRAVPQNTTLQEKQATLLYKIRDLERQQASIQQRQTVKTAAFSFSRSDKRDKNPAIDILIDLYIDNKHITPTPGQFFRVDGQMNIVSEKKKTNQLSIDRLKGMILQLKQQSPPPTREIKRYMDQLAEATRTFNPHFYVTLGDISSLARFVQFTESYQGHDRSPDRVEKNIDILLNLLFGKEEIRVDGKRCKIAKYSWAKEFFPPYGYQTNRGYVEIRTVNPEVVPFTFTRETAVPLETLVNYIGGNTPALFLPQPPDTRAPARSFHAEEDELDRFLVATYPEQLRAAAAKYGTIELAKHAALLVKPDLWYESLKPAQRVDIFLYEYLAYRFSIYQNFFSKKEWSVYSDFPYFVSLQKNSDLLKRLMRLAPDATVRKHLAVLATYWLQEDQRSAQRTAEIQHQLQLLYSARLFVQIKQRVEALHLALNYTVIQVILKEALRCAAAVRKDPAIRCISKVAQQAMKAYLQWRPHDLPAPFGMPALPACPRGEEAQSADALAQHLGVEINGATRPRKQRYEALEVRPVPATEIEVMQEIDRYDAYFNTMAKKPWVRWYVSMRHNLPPALKCVFNHMQQLQVHKYTLEMNGALEDWTKARAKRTEANAALSTLLLKNCMDSARGLLGNDPCVGTIKSAYEKVKAEAAKHLKLANMDDSQLQFTLLQEKYDAWYAPLKDLQDKYTETFGLFREVCLDLTAQVDKIQKDDKNYNLRINQLDYLIDAFETVGEVNMPLKPVPVPTFCEKVEDYAKVTKYLNVLFDLLENKVLRGIMWGSDFKYERPPCRGTQNVRAVLTSPTFLADFAALDPMCVVEYVGTDLNDANMAFRLYQRAIEFISEGHFPLGEEAILLALLFKLKDGDAPLYRKCKTLLIYIWESVGKHEKVRQVQGFEAPSERGRRAYLQHYIRLLRSEEQKKPGILDFLIVIHDIANISTPGNWTRNHQFDDDVVFTSRYDKAIAERVAQFSRETGTFFVSGVVKSLFEKFVKGPKGGAGYHAAFVNYMCMQAAMNGAVARQILTNPELKEADLERVLKYFPPEHNVSNIVGQINAALSHVNFDLTFQFVAQYIFRHRSKGRDTVHETEKCVKKVDISKVVAKLEKVDDKLRFAASLVHDAETERENDWPNKLEDVTVNLSIANKLKLLNRTEAFPHVDGNYTLRCVVTLKLLQKKEKPAETCEEKSAAAWELLRAMT